MNWGGYRPTRPWASIWGGANSHIASQLPSYEPCGEVEADESYFGGVRKGRRGRGAAGKVAVFWLLKRGGKVYTAIIPDARTESLLPIIEEKVPPDSIVYTDAFGAYHALDVGEFHHRRIHPSLRLAEHQNNITWHRELLEPSQRPSALL